jgi:hypothetical protein
MIIACCAGVSLCSCGRLLARAWESETSIVSNVGITYRRLASAYIGTCDGSTVVHVQFGAVVVELLYRGCGGVAGFGDPKYVARLLAPQCTRKGKTCGVEFRNIIPSSSCVIDTDTLAILLHHERDRQCRVTIYCQDSTWHRKGI